MFESISLDDCSIGNRINLSVAGIPWPEEGSDAIRGFEYVGNGIFIGSTFQGVFLTITTGGVISTTISSIDTPGTNLNGLLPVLPGTFDLCSSIGQNCISPPVGCPFPPPAQTLCDKDQFYATRVKNTFPKRILFLVDRSGIPVNILNVPVSLVDGATVQALWASAVDPTTGDTFVVYQVVGDNNAARRLGKLTIDGLTATVEDIGETLYMETITFACNGQLIGVTSRNSMVINNPLPEHLYNIDKFDGSTTNPLLDLTQDSPHAISYNWDTHQLYHFYGQTSDVEFESLIADLNMEAIDLATNTIIQNVPLTASPNDFPAISIQEAISSAFEYIGNGEFLSATTSTYYITISTSGFISVLNAEVPIGGTPSATGLIPLLPGSTDTCFSVGLTCPFDPVGTPAPSTSPSSAPSAAPSSSSSCDCCSRCKKTTKKTFKTTTKGGGTTGKTTTKQTNNLRRRFQEVFAAGSAKGVEEIEALGI